MMKYCKQHHVQPKKLTGFTLVEMSIVLIIIGLIVAGIAKGGDMIRAAKTLSIISNMQQYQIAIRTFDNKYDALPGDMANATDYWASNTSNGNGDRKICCANTGTREIFFIWNHLRLAEMIPGSYTTAISSQPVPGQHVPKVPTGDNDGWWAFHSGTNGHVWGFSGAPIYGKIGNALGIGSDTGNSYLSGGVLTPAEAKSIDVKIDDGMANKGKVFTIKSLQPNNSYVSGCVSQGAAVGASTTVNYTLSDNTQSCHSIFFLD